MTAHSIQSKLPVLMVFFQLQGYTWAVDLGWVSEVVPARTVKPLPNSKIAVAGMMNVRGDVVPVIKIVEGTWQPAQRNGSDFDDETRQALLVDYKGSELGLLVDAVLRVGSPARAEAVALDSEAEYPWARDFVHCLLSLDGGTSIPVLDVPRLMNRVKGFNLTNSATIKAAEHT